jgi:predicted nucleic acid-binding protein
VIIVDTNVLSALMEDAPDERVTRWLDGEPRSAIWTTAVTIFEIEFGLRIMRLGRRQSSLRGDYERCLQIFQRRIADFDAAAAEATATLVAQRRNRGNMRDFRDSMIAGIAIARGASVATRNTRHFADLPVPVVDPWAA